MKVLIAALDSSFTMFIKTKLAKRWAYFVEIATYIKDKGHEVMTLDCLDPKISHGEVLQAIAQNDYELIVFVARPETVRSIVKLSPFVKEISPKSKILIYGDTANYFPNFFKKESIDAVIVEGDWECGLDDYLDYVKKEKSIKDLNGISCNIAGKWTKAKPGKYMLSNDWPLADIKTKNFIDKNLYYSINNSELTITVSRGCPFNCTFCPAVITFGQADRRTPHDKIISYIKENKGGFKSLKFFSPTFTYDKVWVKTLCRLMIENDCVVPWSCTSRPDCLVDLEMIELMAQAGCRKIAIGVETLDKESKQGLKKFNYVENYIDMVETVFKNLINFGIEPKVLMMLGLKGQNRSNIKESFKLLKKFGAKEIRASSYSPRQLLRSKDKDNTLTIDDIEKMDKMTYQNLEIPEMSREEYLRIIYNTEDFLNILK